MDTRQTVTEIHPEYVVDTLLIMGATIFEPAELKRDMNTSAGRAFDPEGLEQDISAMLQRYADAGYPVAEVRVGAVRLLDSGGLEIILRVDERASARLGRVILRGATRTDVSFVQEVAGIEAGMLLHEFSAQQVRTRLRESRLFADVGRPQFRVLPDTSIALVIPVEERQPGSFNIALGYQPPSGNDGGRFVGSGRLALNNVFGRGRQAELRLQQLPEQASRLFAELRAPLIFGLPIGAEASFRGIQQDSTFNEQNYRVGATYAATSRLTGVLFVIRQSTRPGQAGVRLVNGRQIIPRSGAWFAGLGARYVSVDNLLNPSEGVVAAISFEGGQEERSSRRVSAEGDTTRATESIRQERIQGRARIFVPAVGAAHVFVIGADAAIVVSPTYDRSDFFRLGGATSLRGYDEDRFLGRFAGRVLAEYRYALDRYSYVYIFGDLGFLERPDAPGPLDAVKRLLPGYGAGIQFDTRVGLANISFAANPAEPLGIRVHAAISFGL